MALSFVWAAQFSPHKGRAWLALWRGAGPAGGLGAAGSGWPGHTWEFGGAMTSDGDDQMIYALARAAMLVRHALEDDPDQHSTWAKQNREEIAGVLLKLHSLLAEARAAQAKAKVNC